MEPRCGELGSNILEPNQQAWDAIESSEGKYSLNVSLSVFGTLSWQLLTKFGIDFAPKSLLAGFFSGFSWNLLRGRCWLGMQFCSTAHTSKFHCTFLL